MSTPLTDAAIRSILQTGPHYRVNADFARSLEAQLSANKTCKTCKWHTASKPRAKHAEDRNGGVCKCPMLYEDIQSPGGEEHHARTHLVYSYMEGGRFWTGDDFGCIHHAIQQDTP